MKFSPSSARQDGVLGNAVKSKRRIKQFGGKFFKNLKFGPLFVIVVVVQELFGSGLCRELSMASVPLGFRIFCCEGNYWVSENGVFAYGFLPDSKHDDTFVVGIWYCMKGRNEEPRIVWTVGGGIRVSKNSTFMLSMDGSFALCDSNGLLMWSSNTRNMSVQEGSLLNNGNLVLRGFGQNVVWESFRSPTDTLLPGQGIRFPQTLQASSGRSVSGFYSLVILESGNVALMWDQNISYWSSNLSPSSGPKIARFEADGVFALLDDLNQTLWSRSTKDFRDSSVNLRHLKIDADGNLRVYSWDSSLHTWKVSWQAVENQCSVFGSCGLFSICGYNSSGPVCNCLVNDSFDVGSPTAVDVGPYGCKKMVDLGNCKRGTSMLVLKQTVLYGLYPPHDVDFMLSAEACMRYCSNDRSCIAATAKNDGSGLCTIKRTGFISGYQYSSLSSVSFLKPCFVPQAVSAHQATNFPRDSTISAKKVPKDIRRHFLISVVLLFLITASIFITVEMVIVWFIYRRRQMNAQSSVLLQRDALMNPHYRTMIRLSIEEVKDLTSTFSDPVSPNVFRGVLPNHTIVVAKVINDVTLTEREFRMVVSTLGATHHRNLVLLKGFCYEPKNKILIYEYIANGSLDQWLFNTVENQKKVRWQERLEISIGVAKAIAYLHVECCQCIAHGNLKLENVLLDDKLTAKVTNFGLKRLWGNEATSSETLPERDVYMFGEMLLQIVTGRKDDIEETRYSLLYGYCQEGDISSITDTIEVEKGSMELDSVERAIRIAFWCLQDQPFLRPSMPEVVKVLEGSLPVDKPPVSSGFMAKGREAKVEKTETMSVTS
ncbi:hypothetical protein H6P81_010304 [Aristolochia fimbriata]|uniref:Receptor-like serine/threonine-protein kinase n=1 Tax=Aristolochia fimbriata TaxID=158543 RepID=A0AAV7EPL2_ARIFI|nr:hypothetical protein H6P81_010304 [Aristolochia fimbriata]